MELVLFLPAAAFALAGALGVVTARRPVHSALALLAVLVALAFLYLLLWAPFVAVLQVIVYAGAIVVLFLFVIMLLHMQPGEPPREDLRLQRPTAVALGALFLVGLAAVVSGGRSAAPAGRPPAAAPLTPGFGSPEAVGQALFTRFLLPVELAALILLIGMVGAVVLAKGALEVRVPSPVTHPAEAPDEEAEARAPEAVAAP